ncbi:MAG: amino acid adenylation domain-containing protein [Betaproteobacteria bacterium]|nr:MAG: amino acid adenylation domain-containing protein [Betaproteobacteria bacterium]
MSYIFPLSLAQQQLWVLNRLLAGRPVYNVSIVLRLEGALDSAALQRALGEIVRRHEALRTSFETEHGSPVQVIAPQLEFAIEMEELGTLPASERVAEARRRAHEAALRPFDLERAPLLRAHLLRLGELEHWLLLTLHHIITDGWSSGVLQHELSLLYEAFRDRRPSPLPELPVQYADYALWQRDWLQGKDYERQLGFWKEALAGLPVLELPADRPRPPAASYRGGRVRFALAENLTLKLKELGRRERATLFMTLFAALQVLLYRYSGQEDIAVGVPIAGRARAELEGMIGYFVNMLVLRGDLSGEPSFIDCLARVREGALAAYAHQDVPFAKLVEELALRRDPSRNPLFQVSFGLENVPARALRLPGLIASVVDGVGNGTAKFDLDFSLTECQGTLDVVIEYATDLFDAGTIERMAEHWKALLEAIVANPKQRIADLPLLPEAERAQLLVQWNATAVEYPDHRCIHELFEEHAQRAPQATAVVFEGQELTYAEVDMRANRLAQQLRTLGVGPEVLVAIAMERSTEMIVALLGILKAGGAFVPLDPSYPAGRLAFMLEETQAPVLLTQQQLRAQLPAYAGHTLYLDRDWKSIARQPGDNPGCVAKARNLAYVIYTSGSTGQPKGVTVEHRSVVNYLSWLGRAFPLTAGDRVLQKTPISFDASVEEIFFPLVSGAALVIARPAAHRSVAELVGVLKGQRITVLQVVPSLLRSILEHADFRGCDALRLILCGAEMLSQDLVRRLREQSRAELVNLYGPTETTVSSTFWRCQSDANPTSVSAPIGRPIANTHVIILDRSGQLLPRGVPGELCIGGAGVARGYLHRPELTAQYFVPDPLSSNPQARLYKTGDLARHRPDGTLEFLGRRDQQVKIRGYRIEPGEVEAVLKQHVAVQDAVVLAREDRLGEKRLVAYTVGARARSSPSGELRAFLLSRLPDYMVPAAFVSLDALPLTAHGKVDRVSLAAIAPEFEKASQERVAPCNAVEVQLMRIWEQVLDVSPIGMQDNFFALGGDSLGAVRVIDRIEQLLGRQLPPDLLWYQEGTIESLARALLDESGTPVWSGPVPIKTSGKRRPLFCPHIVGGHLFFYDNLATSPCMGFRHAVSTAARLPIQASRPWLHTAFAT